MNTLAMLAALATLSGGDLSQSPLSVERVGKQTVLGLGQDDAFHTTSNRVVNARGLRLPGSDAIVATWDEVIGRRSVSHYAISLDGVEVQRNTEASFDIMAQAGRFDPLTMAVPVRPGMEAGPENENYIVQFVTQPLDEYRVELERLGAKINDYFPLHAYMVRMEPTIKARVAELPFVRAIVPLHPEFKVEEWVKPRLVNGTLPTLRYYVAVFERGLVQKTMVANMIRAIGGTVHFAEEPGFLLEATLTPAQLEQVLRLNEVKFVDRWSEMTTDMNNIRAIGGADYLVSVGNYRGQGVRGEVFDSGFRLTHVGWNPAPATTNPPLVHRAGPIDSHGTSTYGIVFGDGDSSAVGGGMMPFAQGVTAWYSGLLGGAAGRYTEAGELVDPSLPYKCVFQTSSVGDTQTTVYTNISAQSDDILFNFDLTMLQSQSNTGNQNSRPQAWAKNIVSIGAQYHFDNQILTDDRWNGGASVGPAQDLRIKPDLSNAYDATYTTTSSSDTAYTPSFGGTSGATPISAGHFGLFFQLWSNGLFGNSCLFPPLSVFENRPKAQLAKALMINQAFQYGLPETSFGHDMTRYRQGWGKADLRNVYDNRNKIWYVNETDPLNNLQSKVYRVWVPAGEPALKVTMTYLEPQGTTNATLHRKNNLSLKVTTPGGTLYWGNNGLITSNWSTAGGVEDNINTVENVYIQNPASGVWTIEVVGSDINTDARLETPGVNADFALIASGVTPAIVPGSFTTSQGSLLGGNLASLTLSENNRMTLGESQEADSVDGRRWLQVTGTSPSQTLTVLKFRLESAATQPTVRADVKLYDYVAGGFTTVGTTANLTSGDQVFEFGPLSNPSRFVQAGTRAVLARMEWYDTNTASDTLFTGTVDQVRWLFEP